MAGFDPNAIFGALSGGGGMMPGMPGGGQQPPQVTMPQIFGAPVQHDNTWMQYPGMAIGGVVGGMYGGPMGAMAGSKGGGAIGSGIGDAVGGNWNGVGQDALSSVQDGINQGLQGMNPTSMAQGMNPMSLVNMVGKFF